jgi:succinate dehydrogenase/fumarate reductase flavoprotein subunit
VKGRPVSVQNSGNIKTEAGVNGLYAAGEVTGGLYGANRLDGVSIPEILIFGEIAGKEAAHYSTQVSRERLPYDIIRKEKDKVLGFLNAASGKIFLSEAKKLLGEVMLNCFGIIRYGEGMKKGLAELNRIEKDIFPSLLIRDKSLIGNYDWIETQFSR